MTLASADHNLDPYILEGYAEHVLGELQFRGNSRKQVRQMLARIFEAQGEWVDGDEIRKRVVEMSGGKVTNAIQVRTSNAQRMIREEVLPRSDWLEVDPSGWEQGDPVAFTRARIAKALPILKQALKEGVLDAAYGFKVYYDSVEQRNNRARPRKTTIPQELVPEYLNRLEHWLGILEKIGGEKNAPLTTEPVSPPAPPTTPRRIKPKRRKKPAPQPTPPPRSASKPKPAPARPSRAQLLGARGASFSSEPEESPDDQTALEGLGLTLEQGGRSSRPSLQGLEGDVIAGSELWATHTGEVDRHRQADVRASRPRRGRPRGSASSRRRSTTAPRPPDKIKGFSQFMVGEGCLHVAHKWLDGNPFRRRALQQSGWRVATEADIANMARPSQVQDFLDSTSGGIVLARSVGEYVQAMMIPAKSWQGDVTPQATKTPARRSRKKGTAEGLRKIREAAERTDLGEHLDTRARRRFTFLVDRGDGKKTRNEALKSLDGSVLLAMPAMATATKILCFCEDTEDLVYIPRKYVPVDILEIIDSN